jgi:hypothetical protein
MNALLRKEIRDAVRWLPLGFVLLGLLLVYTCKGFYSPNLSSQLYLMTWFSALLYGSFLGLVTFLPDEREAARAFLIHRAIAPNQIFQTRVLVGLLVYAVGMFLPLALLAVYLAAIGPERLPVSPWQVVPTLLTVVSGSIFYFAGIVIACRPANWFGTRLLPLALAVGGSFLSLGVLAVAPPYVTLPLYALSCACAVLMAFAARHAFVRNPSQVAPTRVHSTSMAMRFILLASSILVVGTVGLLPLNLTYQTTYRYPTTEFDKDGIPVYVVRSSARNRDGVNETLESIPMMDASEPRPERIEISDLQTRFLLIALAEPSNRFDPTFLHQIGDRQVFFDPSGYLLVYQMNNPFGAMLEWVIASDTVSQPNERRGTPFQKIPRLLMTQNFYPQINVNFETPQPATPQLQSLTKWTIMTSDGILQVDLEKRLIESLLKQSIDSFGLPIAGGAEWLAIQAGDSVRVYKTDASKLGVQPTQFTLLSTLNTAKSFVSSLCYRDGDNWTYLDGYATQRSFNVTRCTAGETRSYPFAPPGETLKSIFRQRNESLYVFGALPPLLSVGSWVVTQSYSEFNAIDFLPLFIKLLAAITLTVLATRYRGLSPRQTAVWVVLAGLLGLGVPLAVLAIYPMAVYEVCSGCQRRRRVENATCEHCGADWDALPTEGIEIVEGGAVETLSAVGPA